MYCNWWELGVHLPPAPPTTINYPTCCPLLALPLLPTAPPTASLLWLHSPQRPSLLPFSYSSSHSALHCCPSFTPLPKTSLTAALLSPHFLLRPSLLPFSRLTLHSVPSCTPLPTASLTNIPLLSTNDKLYIYEFRTLLINDGENDTRPHNYFGRQVAASSV